MHIHWYLVLGLVYTILLTSMRLGQVLSTRYRIVPIIGALVAVLLWPVFVLASIASLVRSGK